MCQRFLFEKDCGGLYKPIAVERIPTMSLEDERRSLLDRKKLRTEIAGELYGKYYFILFEIAKDLKHSNVKEVSITKDSVVITTAKENILLHCPEGDVASALAQLSLPGAENNEQKMLVELIRGLAAVKGGDHSKVAFFDIGANIGWYSIYLEKLFKGLRIHAFEPVKTTYEQFLKNMALNQTGPLRANNFGLADACRTVDFYVSPSLLAASSLADTFESRDKIRIQSEVRRLDDYCRENAVAPDLIKCDVEGAEFLVFKGAEKILSEARPVVMTELLRKWAKRFDYHPNDVIQYFSDKGYACYVISEGKLKPFGTVTEDTVETNYFFLHHEKHEKLLKCRIS